MQRLAFRDMCSHGEKAVRQGRQGRLKDFHRRLHSQVFFARQNVGRASDHFHLRLHRAGGNLQPVSADALQGEPPDYGLEGREFGRLGGGKNFLGSFFVKNRSFMRCILLDFSQGFAAAAQGRGALHSPVPTGGCTVLKENSAARLGHHAWRCCL
ncbi:hypothetical protein IWX85_000347 [Polaromonas sp. CG_9.11]|nr:hypothetical protein [Polaromonas sp. CG_9.11]MBG6074540.1 hypothetical protein [Polaromonas sp. CG_9.11]